MALIIFKLKPWSIIYDNKENIKIGVNSKINPKTKHIAIYFDNSKENILRSKVNFIYF